MVQRKNKDILLETEKRQLVQEIYSSLVHLNFPAPALHFPIWLICIHPGTVFPQIFPCSVSSFLIPLCAPHCPQVAPLPAPPPAIAKSVFTQVTFTIPSLPWWMEVAVKMMRRRIEKWDKIFWKEQKSTMKKEGCRTKRQKGFLICGGERRRGQSCGLASEPASDCWWDLMAP